VFVCLVLYAVLISYSESLRVLLVREVVSVLDEGFRVLVFHQRV